MMRLTPGVEMPDRDGERVGLPTGAGLGGELDMDAVGEFTSSKGEVT